VSAVGEFWDHVTQAANWTGDGGLLELTWAHVRLSVLATTATAVLGLPAAILLGARGRGGTLAVSVVNIGRALPSFAVLVLAFGIFTSQWQKGFTIWPTFVALVLLGLPPVFTNAFTGVRGVDPDAREAATAMGMTRGERLRRVEVPLALPLILTGLRLSAVQIVATATLGAWVGFRCLGTPIFEGFAQQDDGKILTGAVLVAVLTILTEVAFSLLTRAMTPWQREGGGVRGTPADRPTDDRPTVGAPSGAPITQGAP
jgi:osmoprotectant transport system permease protein